MNITVIIQKFNVSTAFELNSQGRDTCIYCPSLTKRQHRVVLNYCCGTTFETTVETRVKRKKKIKTFSVTTDIHFSKTSLNERSI